MRTRRSNACPAESGYREEDSGRVYSANALMSQGLPMPKITVPGLSHQVIPGEYEAFQIHLCKV